MTTKNLPSSLPFPIRFYSPTSPTPDSRDRTLTSILAWPDSTLESSHDYIQNLFPLPERSPINPSAPVIDEKTFTTFRSSQELQEQLRMSLKRMLKFYGFELVEVKSSNGEENGEENTFNVQPAQNFKTVSRNWFTRFDHNHLRITRIVRSCRVLGLEDEAASFHDALVKVSQERPGVISKKSLMFWRRAAERPLYLAPEDDEDWGRGKEWLYRFEEEKTKTEQEEAKV
ncbi:MAG: hypothetical protein Q9166_007234 [cf. Caloplaca sp. 2 TL-2023]